MDSIVVVVVAANLFDTRRDRVRRDVSNEACRF